MSSRFSSIAPNDENTTDDYVVEETITVVKKKKNRRKTGESPLANDTANLNPSMSNTPPPTPPSSDRKQREKKLKEAVIQAKQLQKAALKAPYATSATIASPAKVKRVKSKKTSFDKLKKSSDWNLSSLLQLVLLLLVILLHRCPPNNPTMACRSFRDNVPYAREMIWWYQESIYPVVEENLVQPATTLYHAKFAPIVEPLYDRHLSPLVHAAEPYAYLGWSKAHGIWYTYVSPILAQVYDLYATHVQPHVHAVMDMVDETYTEYLKAHVDKSHRWVRINVNPVVQNTFSNHVKPAAIHVWTVYITPGFHQTKAIVIDVYNMHVHPFLLNLWTNHLEEHYYAIRVPIVTLLYGDKAGALAAEDHKSIVLLKTRALSEHQVDVEQKVEPVVEESGDVKILPVVNEEEKRKEHEAKLKKEEEAKIKAEAEARLKAEAEAKKLAEEESKRKVKEDEEKSRLEADAKAKKLAEEEAKRKAKEDEEKARLEADVNAKKLEEEQAQAAAEKIKKEAEQKAKEQAENAKVITEVDVEEEEVLVKDDVDVKKKVDDLLNQKASAEPDMDMMMTVIETMQKIGNDATPQQIRAALGPGFDDYFPKEGEKYDDTYDVDVQKIKEKIRKFKENYENKGKDEL